MGDECSMPGRLEELNKTYGTQPLCANISTRHGAESEKKGFAFRPLAWSLRGLKVVKGDSASRECMKLRLLVSETTHTDLDIEGFVSRPIDAEPAFEN